ILVPVFSIAHPGLVLGIGGVMVVLAGRASILRTKKRFGGDLLVGVVSMVMAAVPTTLFATTLLLDIEPFWKPQYAIPLLGMILGNTLTGVSLGIDRVLTGVTDRRSELELMLAFGARPWEASRPLAAEALRTGMVPILNSMTVVGLVTIPGMMTGQILAGTDPALAARYQILILFLIAAAVALGTLSAVLLTVRRMFDEAGRLRPERIVESA
ncbi:MAG: ABC transporter permease, partial [Proteobacteria bacterium]|nr:ABC transporter permease [Pseudomonadota bacterium]